MYFFLFHFQLIFVPYLSPFVNYLNDLSSETQIITTSRCQALLNGPHFTDNIFQSTVCNGIPTIERISYDEAVQQTS